MEIYQNWPQHWILQETVFSHGLERASEVVQCYAFSSIILGEKMTDAFNNGIQSFSKDGG